jgi:hypothetical protein
MRVSNVPLMLFEIHPQAEPHGMKATRAMAGRSSPLTHTGVGNPVVDVGGAHFAERIPRVIANRFGRRACLR